MRSTYLVTSERVSEGHPDTVADQISDAIVDLFLSKDPEARIACETLTTTQLAGLSATTMGALSTARTLVRRDMFIAVLYLAGSRSSTSGKWKVRPSSTERPVVEVVSTGMRAPGS